MFWWYISKVFNHKVTIKCTQLVSFLCILNWIKKIDFVFLNLHILYFLLLCWITLFWRSISFVWKLNNIYIIATCIVTVFLLHRVLGQQHLKTDIWYLMTVNTTIFGNIFLNFMHVPKVIRQGNYSILFTPNSKPFFWKKLLYNDAIAFIKLNVNHLVYLVSAFWYWSQDFER